MADIDVLIKRAESGDGEATCELGDCYFEGNGVEIDFEKASNYYFKAVVKGNVLAQYRLGVCFYEGLGAKKDEAEALKLFKKVVPLLKAKAKGGDAKAQCYLGCCYNNGYGVKRNIKKAVNLYKQSAAQGFGAAQCYLGLIYLKGDGMPQDCAEAFGLLTKAAEQGNVLAQNYLGHCLKYGKGTERDGEKAFYWFEKAAEQGDGKILPVKDFSQEDAEKQSRQPKLHRHQQREVIQHLALRHQNAEQVQRASQIVGDHAQVVHAHSHIPAVEQAVPAAQGLAEGHKEGIILVVVIRIQHGPGAEGMIAVDDHYPQHSKEGNQKGQCVVLPAPLPAGFF